MQNNTTTNSTSKACPDRQRILMDLFQKLPTDFLLCAVRLSCREWKQMVESDCAQKALWQPRATYFQMHAGFVASQCAQQLVRLDSHQEAEKNHNTIFTNLDRCLHYYTRILLWLTQRKICGSWMAHYYTSTGEMHKYWYMKHGRAQRMGDAFNEVDTEVALQTVASSRNAALDTGLTVFETIPFTPPI